MLMSIGSGDTFFFIEASSSENGEEEIRQFISDLAVNRRVSASTQTVALSALLFLYRRAKERPSLCSNRAAQRHKKLPVVFTRDESVESRLRREHRV